VAATATYLLNKAWTFGGQTGGRGLGLWVGLMSISAAINYGVYAASLNMFALVQQWPELGVALGSFAAMGLNFASARFIVFRQVQVTAGPGPVPLPPQFRHGLATRIAHASWGLLAVVNMILGWWWISGTIPAALSKPVALHAWLGLFVLMIAAARLTLRIGKSAPAYADGPPDFLGLVHLVHGMLYAGLGLVSLSGLAMAGLSGGLGPMFGWAVGSASLPAAVTALIHVIGVYILLGLVLAHVLGALVHGLVWRDRIIGRMWPPW
jgi:cytochrome b561